MDEHIATEVKGRSIMLVVAVQPIRVNGTSRALMNVRSIPHGLTVVIDHRGRSVRQYQSVPCPYRASPVRVAGCPLTAGYPNLYFESGRRFAKDGN